MSPLPESSHSLCASAPLREATTRHQLLTAVVEVTNRCNLRCPHCASDSGCARADELSLDELRQVIADLRSLGCREFTMLGGEFVLRPDWEEIARTVKDAGLELQLVTNGLLITPDIRRRLRDLDPQTVGVSLDGASPASYRRQRGVDGYAICRRLLNDLCADGFREVHAITTFNAKNLVDFELFAESFLDTKIVWQVQMAHRGGERFPDDLLMNRDQYKTLVDNIIAWQERYPTRLRILPMDDFGYYPMSPRLKYLADRWQGCPAGRFTIGIRANGDVLPCLSLGSAFIEDNLRRRPLTEIWNDPDSFPAFRHKAEELTGACGKCPLAAKCRAGCSAMAISQTGTLTETPFCIRQVETERLLGGLL